MNWEIQEHKEENFHRNYVGTMDFAMKFHLPHSFNGFHTYHPVIQISFFRLGRKEKQLNLSVLNSFTLVKKVIVPHLHQLYLVVFFLLAPTYTNFLISTPFNLKAVFVTC